MTIEQQAIQIVNHGKVWLNNTQNPIVQLTILPGEMSSKPQLNFTWNCTSVTPMYMEFQLDFDFIPDISLYYDYKESIKVSFLGKRYFPAADDG
jgi:hypothetical protein